MRRDQRIELQTMTNREKAIVIDDISTKCSLDELLLAVGIAKGSYFCQIDALSRPDKHIASRKEVGEVFRNTKRVYGYRRVPTVLKKQGISCSRKVARRTMCEDHIIVQEKRQRRSGSYLGEISPTVPSVLERAFHSEKANEKGLTDLNEFHIPEGKVHLSPIIECFDGMVIS
jgi:putative transposase